MATYAALRKQIEDLTKRAEDARKAEIRQLVGDIRRQIQEFGLTPDDLFGGAARKQRSRPARAVGSTNPPKYRDPETGKTWTGIGKPPLWIAGKDRSGYLIDGAAPVPAGPKPARGARAKPAAAKQARGAAAPAGRKPRAQAAKAEGGKRRRAAPVAEGAAEAA